MKLIDILFEVFNSTMDVTWTGNKKYEAKFKGPNNIQYEITLTPLYWMGFDFDFIDKALNKMSEDFFEKMFESDEDGGYEFIFVDQKGSSDITGEAGAQSSKILGIVINATIDKINKENIKYLYFTAFEPSRKSLYKKMTKILSKKLGYYSTFINFDGATHFIISKDKFK